MTTPESSADAQQRAIENYWNVARMRAKLSGMEWLTGDESAIALTPPAWALGSTPEESDELLALVLAGAKTATSSAAAVYAKEGVAPPAEGDLSIVLDGHGRPRALVVTTQVRICAFDEVDAAHAAAEGEGDLSLAYWRRVHEKFFTDELAQVGEQFNARTAVVLESIRVLDPR